MGIRAVPGGNRLQGSSERQGRSVVRRCIWDPSLAVLIIGLALAAGGQESDFLQGMFDLRAPLLVTTCGQSPGAPMLGLVCGEAGIACVRQDLVYAGDLAADCPPGAEIYHAGVLFVTTGTSLKGVGAAGSMSTPRWPGALRWSSGRRSLAWS